MKLSLFFSILGISYGFIGGQAYSDGCQNDQKNDRAQSIQKIDNTNNTTDDAKKGYEIASSTGLSNPASVFCMQAKGKIEILKQDGNVTGLCHLPDHRVIEQWAFFRSEAHQTTNNIPASQTASSIPTPPINNIIQDHSSQPMTENNQNNTQPNDNKKSQSIGMANPASVFCIKSKGRLEIKQDAQGNQYGLCHLPDGRIIEEWSFFRSEKSKIMKKN